MIETITSEQNALLKRIRAAARAGALTDEGCAIAEGWHLLEEAVRSGAEIAAVVAAESAAARLDGFAAPRLVTVTDRTFESLGSTETPQGVLTLVRPKTWTLDDVLGSAPLIVVMDRIQDPGNAGAIVRVAEAFGATGVVMLKGSANPWNPKSIRGSAGSVFRMPIVLGIDAKYWIEWVGSQRLTMLAAEGRASLDASQADFRQACALVIGSEGSGVAAELRLQATAIRIPTLGVESLDAAVAAGILLYEARRQRSTR